MKIIAKKVLPLFIISILKNIHFYFKRKQIKYIFGRMYKMDMLRYLKYSRTLGNDNANKMIGAIVLQYHVIEKGLTMPNTKLGFGKKRIIALCRSCLKYIDSYGQNDTQLIHAIGVILEYEEYHNTKNFKLADEVIALILQLKNVTNEAFQQTTQIQITRKEYFIPVNSSFYEFSNSRKSVRNYTSGDLPLEKILTALDLASNAPSACNRQAWRTYVYTDKTKISKILEAQGGNKGFGHLANKLIIITGVLGVFSSTNERYQVYIDGGIYAMNLLYALHYNEIAACIMNCSFDFKKEQYIKELSEIKESEVLIAMVACGMAPVEFKIAISPRYTIEKTNKIIK